MLTGCADEPLPQVTVSSPSLNIPLGHGCKATIKPGFLHEDIGALHLKAGGSDYELHCTITF